MIDRIGLAKTHQEKDDRVFGFFDAALKDIGTVFKRDQNGRSFASERMQLIAVFSLIDIIASYWFEYQGKNKKKTGHGERFAAWINEYGLAPRNHSYSGTDFAKLTTERLYHFRCSMIHFMGMSDGKARPAICIASNEIKKSEVQKMREGFRKRGVQVVIFKPKQLYNLICDGVIEMMDDWKEIILESDKDDTMKWAHMEGIDRIFQRIEFEGAARVDLPKYLSP